jgi:hypothetical protein
LLVNSKAASLLNSSSNNNNNNRNRLKTVKSKSHSPPTTTTETMLEQLIHLNTPSSTMIGCMPSSSSSSEMTSNNCHHHNSNFNDENVKLDLENQNKSIIKQQPVNNETILKSLSNTVLVNHPDLPATTSTKESEEINASLGLKQNSKLSSTETEIADSIKNIELNNNNNNNNDCNTTSENEPQNVNQSNETLTHESKKSPPLTKSSDASNLKESSSSTPNSSTTATTSSSFLTTNTSSPALNLPEHWEARVDNLGRVFYIDHVNRTTTWKRPKMNTNQTTQELANQRILNSEIEKQRLDKRYQSIRRTIQHSSKKPSHSLLVEDQHSSSTNDAPIESSTSNTSLNNTEINSSSQEQIQRITTTAKHHTSQLNIQDPLLKQPGAQFVQRVDLHHLIKHNLEAKEFVKQSPTLISILQKIRSNPLVYYKKYQHNKELVKFLNMFSNKSEQLPPGWEMKLEITNKLFFVDHNSRSTTFIDPRLPLLPSNSSSNSSSSSSSPLNGNKSNSSNPPHITTITTISPSATLTRHQANAIIAAPTTTNTATSTANCSIPKMSKMSTVLPLTQQSNEIINSNIEFPMPPNFPPPPPPPPPHPTSSLSQLIQNQTISATQINSLVPTSIQGNI